MKINEIIYVLEDELTIVIDELDVSVEEKQRVTATQRFLFGATRWMVVCKGLTIK